MATYAQWRRNADKGEVRRATWVCGDQRVLVEEVVDHVRDSLAVSDLDYVNLAGGTVPDREVWAAAGQYPMQPGANRLVLVRDAQKISNWNPLTEWLAASRLLPTVHLLLVSGESDFPYETVGRRKTNLKPHLEAIKARGHMVRCAQLNEFDAVAWVRRRAPLDDRTARHLLTRCGGNLGAAASVCAKVSLFDGQAGVRTVDQLCAEIPGDSFVESLVLGDKKAALAHAERMRVEEYGRALSLLDSRLDLLGQLWKQLRGGHPERGTSGTPLFLVKQYSPVARHYDPRRCGYSRRVLAVVEDAHRNGARDGLLECLVALW